MKSTLNKTDDVNGSIIIELEKADYQEQVDKSLNKLRQKANIPGFRQGKVPKSVIRKLYGKSVMAEEINKIVSDEVSNFIRDNKLKILGEPLLDNTEEKQVDLDKDDEVFTFYFDVGLTPEFELKIDKEIEHPYYSVDLEQDILDKQIDSYKQNYGTYITVEEEAIETDMIKGILTEVVEGEAKGEVDKVKDGEAKEELWVIENAILMPSYLKDEEIKKSFVGSKVGDTIQFNPKKAYDNNEAEVASLLQTTKDVVKDVNSDFRFEIKEDTRYKEAELNQDIFDRVLGEGVATTGEEFKDKVKEMLERQFKPSADHLFIHEMRDRIVEKMNEVEFPDLFLKRWLNEISEERTAEQVEEDYPKLLDDIKFQVVTQRIVEENEIKVEFQDIEAMAMEVAAAQFAQYGMTNLPPDMLQNYSKSLLEKEDSVRDLYERVKEERIIEWLKDNITLINKKVSSEEFNEVMAEHSKLHGHGEEDLDEEVAGQEQVTEPEFE